jgi:hypothetical protein
MIGTASVGTSLSQYVDSLANNQISAYMKAHVPIHLNNFGAYPDFLAFSLIMLVVCMLLSFYLKSLAFVRDYQTTFTYSK